MIICMSAVHIILLSLTFVFVIIAEDSLTIVEGGLLPRG